MARRLTSTILRPVFVLFVLYGSPSFAQGGKFYASLSGIYDDDEFKAGPARDHATTLVTMLSAGYAQNPGWFLGIRYYQFDRDRKDGNSRNSGLLIKGLGPVAGFLHDSGFCANLTYLLSPTKEQAVSSGGESVTAEFKGGTGYVIEVGKLWMLGTSIGGSLQLAYSKIDYKKVENPTTSETSLDGTWYDKFIYPHLGLFLFF